MRTERLVLITLALLFCRGAALAQEKALTVEEIFHPDKKVSFAGTPPASVEWLADGESFLQPKKEGGLTTFLKVNARTGDAAPFFDAAKMEAALLKIQGVTREQARELAHQDSYQLNPAQTAVLLNAANDIFYYELGSADAVRLTSDAEEETEEDFSPDGRAVSFVRANDLYVVDLSTRAERRLTKNGGEKNLNGVLDWVYEEEVYGRGNRRGYWWSPDSRSLAYLSTDESPVKIFPVVDHIPRAQVLEDDALPAPGRPEPDRAARSRRGLRRRHALGRDRRIRADGLSRRARRRGRPTRRASSIQAQNREQTFLDLNAADASTGKTTRLFRDTTKAWVEAVDDNPRWLKDGSFLWRSERDGWLHLYHYSADGKLIRRVTEGRWEVRYLDAVDEQAGVVYFRGTEHSHIAEQVYRVGLDGSGLKRLSQSEGTHKATFIAERRATSSTTGAT